MKARTVSLSIVGLLVAGGAAGIVVPRITGDANSSDSGTTPTGSGSGSAYCKTLSAKRSQVADIVGSGDPTALVNNLPLFQSLAVNAPPDISASWTAFNTAIASLGSAIKASGHQPAEFTGGTFPPGLSPAQTQAIKDAASTLTSSVTQSASTAIEQEVRDVCQVNLGM